ncbi:MAG: C-GCAxxG-C-C family protein [candidate division Zixibacteria bacterium]|nr:C-GCAxxG-C-C family protein [candidate division Zixibacteria bacterium]
MNRKELAIERFRGDYNCAQSVLSVFAADFGLDEKVALRIAWPFGGGMARLQKTCGAVTGAYMVIGLAWGTKKPETEEEKEKVYQVVQQFTARFEAIHGATDCLTLLGQDISTPEGRQKSKDENRSALRCEKYVGDAVTILEDLLKTDPV